MTNLAASGPGGVHGWHWGRAWGGGRRRCRPRAGWFTDPAGRFKYRYWSGDAWTDRVVAAGVREPQTDPLEPSLAHTPPAAAIPEPAPQAEDEFTRPRRFVFPWKIVVPVFTIAAAIGIGLLIANAVESGSTDNGAPTVTVVDPSLVPATGPQLVTEQEALAVVAEMWPAREQALVANDIAATNRLETGTAREFDNVGSRKNVLENNGAGTRRVRACRPGPAW